SLKHVRLRGRQLLLPQGGAGDGPLGRRRAHTRHAVPRGEGQRADDAQGRRGAGPARRHRLLLRVGPEHPAVHVGRGQGQRRAPSPGGAGHRAARGLRGDGMTPSESSKIIRGVLCRGLSHEQTEQILKAMVPLKAKTGLVVFKEGERPQGLMVLVEGTVEVFKDGSNEVLATIAAPTVLGEISLLTEGPHTASVRAKTACDFGLLTTTQFHRLLREESLAAYKVIAILAEVL